MVASYARSKRKVDRMFKSVTSALAAAFFTVMMGGLVADMPASAQTAEKPVAVDADADEVLRGMAAYLKGLKSFTVSFDSDLDVLTHEGEELQFSSSGTVAVERPGKLHATRRGGVIDAEFTYDGKSLTIHDRWSKLYAQYAVPGNIDDALDMARDGTGFHFAGADLLYGDVYPGRNLEVQSARYIGVVMVNGMKGPPPRLPRQGHRLAALGAGRRYAASAQIRHHEQMDGCGAAVLIALEGLGYEPQD